MWELMGTLTFSRASLGEDCVTRRGRKAMVTFVEFYSVNRGIWAMPAGFLCLSQGDSKVEDIFLRSEALISILGLIAREA
jgi:hypothetical protein